MLMSDNPIEASEMLLSLMFAALDHGIDSVRLGGPLIPFVMIQRGEERGLTRFVSELLEDAVAEARKYIAENAATLQAYALTVDGYFTINEHKFDAILVEGEERGSGFALQFAQRYTPFDGDTPLETIGNAAYISKLDGKLT
jgi:hypothetical protein